MVSCVSKPVTSGGGGDDTFTTAELYIVITLLSLMSLVGTAGNALVIYVFSKKRDKQVSTLFIVVMAIVDFTTCLFVIPYTIVMEYIEFNIKFDALCKLYQFLITSNIPFSALVMVAIAVDRYLCICHPFLRALTVARAKKVTISLALCAVGLGVIVALMYGVYTLPPAKTCDQHVLNGTLGDVILNTTSIHIASGASVARNDAVTAATSSDTRLGDLSYQHVTHSASGAEQPDVGANRQYVYTGFCGPNELLISESFQGHFQRFYTAIFVLCLAVVVVLYTLIYRSVLGRRRRREQQKSKALPLIEQHDLDTPEPSHAPATMLTVLNGHSVNGCDAQLAQQSVDADDTTCMTHDATIKLKKKQSLKRNKQKTTRKDKLLMANLKTAGMLFVVTVVFIVTYAPALLMALNILPYNIVIFYMYFANNVANPVIYSFMNKNFRDDLRKLFCRKKY